MTNSLKFYPLTLIVVFLFCVSFQLSCKKETKCEKWQWNQRCEPKLATVHCFDYGVQTGNLCGKALDGIYPGFERLDHEDESARIYTRYIKKVE